MTKKRRRRPQPPPKAEQDFWETPHVKRWVEHVITGLMPKMEQSHVVMSLAPRGKVDVKFMVETGAAVCLDKPIIIVKLPGSEVSHKLLQIADEVVELDEGINPESTQELAKAFDRVRLKYEAG